LKNRKLRAGFTTGTAAAAATKAALTCLLEGTCSEKVSVKLLTGKALSIAVKSARRLSAERAVALVVKDAGDDPDITHKALIGARVTLLNSAEYAPEAVLIEGGRGVGRVTKPGLDVPPGGPAINPGPQRMIREAVADVRRRYGRRCPVAVQVFVPRGAELARKTLNARLGILGGISILGTTGLVRPMSHEAYRATIRKAMDVARAVGAGALVLTTGRRSERFSQALWSQQAPETFVQIGDYFAFSLRTAVDRGFEGVTLAVFFGKAVKMARGVPHTHAAKSRQSLAQLAGWTLAETGDDRLAEKVRSANTARHAFDMLYPEHAAVVRRVGLQVMAEARRFSEKRLAVRCVIFNFKGNVIFNSREPQ
jgi:cobalt-precorrin-5B (C1)-methyltransferase